MFYVGMDLSRKRLDHHVLTDGGATVETGVVSPHRDGLGRLALDVGEVAAARGGVIVTYRVTPRLRPAARRALASSPPTAAGA